MDQHQLPPALQRKLSRLVDHSASGEIWSKDLSTLSSMAILTTNTPTTRRTLRSSVEHEIVASHARFAEETAGMTRAIDEVEERLTALQGLCERMAGVVEAREGEVGRVLDEIRGLERSIEVTEARKGWLEEYQGKYQLSPETIQILKQGGNVPTSVSGGANRGDASNVVLNDAFFEALTRVQVVYANCKALGLSSSGATAAQHPTTTLKGLQLVEQLSKLQDEAFRHVCSWIQRECQRIESPDDAQSAEITETMPKAMKCLRARPPLYSYCAEEIAIARKTAVYQKFIQALSQGARPIESHSSDPWRYANDMLAWIHASIAGEMELVGVMFEGCYSASGLVKRTESLERVVEDGSIREKAGMQGGDNVGDGGDGDGADAGGMTQHLSLQEIMDTIFESVCRPLKRRLDQILLAAPSPVLNFQLATLFSFYIKTIAPVMGDKSHLSVTLRACRAASEKALKDQMKQRGERLVRQPPMPPEDLGFPASHSPYTDRLEIGLSIIKFYDGSFLVGHTDTPGEHDEAATLGDNPEDPCHADDGDTVDSLLDAIISPLVDSILTSADALNPTSAVRLDDSGSSMSPSKQHVYIINCLSHIRSKFMPYPSAASLCARLASQIDEEMARLVHAQASSLLRGTGLDPTRRTTVGKGDDTEQLATDASTVSNISSPAEAANAADALWTKLSERIEPTEDVLPHGVIDERVRSDVARATVTRVLDAYINAYHSCAMDGGARTRLHSPEEVEAKLNQGHPSSQYADTAISGRGNEASRTISVLSPRHVHGHLRDTDH